MGLIKDSEAYRAQMLRRLKNENENLIAEAQKLKDAHTNNEKKIARLKLPLPNQDTCARCFYDHGAISTLYAVGSDLTHIDRFRCRDCGQVLEVRV